MENMKIDEAAECTEIVENQYEGNISNFVDDGGARRTNIEHDPPSPLTVLHSVEKPYPAHVPANCCASSISTGRLGCPLHSVGVDTLLMDTSDEKTEWRHVSFYLEGMHETQCCRNAWYLTALFVGLLCLWRLSDSPTSSNWVEDDNDDNFLVQHNFLPLVSGNATTTPDPCPLHTLPNSDLKTLMDLENFTFLANPPCNSANTSDSSGPLVVVVVHSAPENWKNREMIRLTWGSTLDLVFLLGTTNSTSVNTRINEEIKEYRDIVQGSFVDSYRNMTYKHVMGLKWMIYRCSGAKYFLKTDDDVFVNMPVFQELLTDKLSPMGARRLILCNMIKDRLVQRSYRHKWRVSPKEYPHRWFPPYCFGHFILYSPDVVFILNAEAQRSRYFWIDDVLVTGILVSQANLTHTPLIDGDIFNCKRDSVSCIAPPSSFWNLWKRFSREDSL